MTTITLKSPFQYHSEVKQHGLTQVMRTATIWYDRAMQRKQLAGLSTEQLRDIGVNYEQAMAEAEKSFWQC